MPLENVISRTLNRQNPNKFDDNDLIPCGLEQNKSFFIADMYLKQSFQSIFIY